MQEQALVYKYDKHLVQQLHGGEKTILVYFHFPAQANEAPSELEMMKMKRAEAAGGERAEQLQEAETKCCRVLDTM